MAEEFLSRADFGQFVARMDERFDHVEKGMADLRNEIRAEMREMRTDLRSQRVLMMALLGPLVVSLSLAIVGGLAKLVFFM